MKRALASVLLVIGCSSASTNETSGPAIDAGPDAILWQDPLCQSVPDDLAFPCESDEQCLGHRCSRTFDHCVWPCASDCDCADGYHCEAPACRPN